MIKEIANDDMHRRSPRHPVPAAFGQAALLLAESILHTLIEQHVLTTTEAAGAVLRAIEVKIHVAAEMAEPHDVLERSLGLLRQIRSSLLSDSSNEELDFGNVDFI